MLKHFLKNSSGTQAVEYCIIVAVIVLAVIVGFQMVHNATTNTYNKVTNAVGSTPAR